MIRSRSLDQPYLETPRGILSRGGLLYHTSVERLTEEYGEVLEERPLEKLIDSAELWITSHRAVTLWVLIPLLVYLPVPVAGPLALCVFVSWKALAPAIGGTRLEVPIRLLSSVGAQMVGYVIAMSWLGATGRYTGLGVGLAGFVVIRWQLLDYLLRPLTDYVHRRLFPLPVSDQMLRAVIHSVAIRLKIALPQFPTIGRWHVDGTREDP